MEYLFDYWDNLKKNLINKYIIIFLDYDGTLTPIVETPKEAIISKESRDLLNRLSKSPRCRLAIISGRALKDIKNKIRLNNIIYSGNHGLEIEGPKIKFKSPVSLEYKTTLKQIKNYLSKRLSTIKGAFLEDKSLSLSLHYRLVDKKQIPLVKNIFHEATTIYLVRNKIKIKPGKMVFEIRPPIKWDKGKIVLWLLTRQQFILRGNNIFPIYIGDDVTDEDVFGVLKNKGLTVFVGEPRVSQAKYYLKNSKEVIGFLRRILALQKST